MEKWVPIIQANIKELHDLRAFHSLGGEEALYLDILYYYNLGALPELELLRPHLNNLKGDSSALLLALYELRWMLLTRAADPARLDEISRRTFPHGASIALRAELRFLLGLGDSQTGRNVSAKEHYREAVHLYRNCGATRKAVKALNNFVAIETKSAPGKRLIPSYFHVYRTACEVSESCIAGMALFNISREFEKLGALDLSLQKSNESLKEMRDDLGSLHYCMAMAHRAQLLYRLRRYKEAEMDYGFLSSSEFTEIQEIQKVLDYYRLRDWNQAVEAKDLPFMWREKYDEIRTLGRAHGASAFSPLEEALVAKLAYGPQDKFVLIESLYPDDKSGFASKEDRLMVLLSRARKRHPGLFYAENGKYHLLADWVSLPELQMGTR